MANRPISTTGALALAGVGIGLIGVATAATQGSANALEPRERDAQLRRLFPKKDLHWASYSVKNWGRADDRYAMPFPTWTLTSVWMQEWERDDHYKRVNTLERPSSRHRVPHSFPTGPYWLHPDGNLSQDYRFTRGLGGRVKITIDGKVVPLHLLPDEVQDRIGTVRAVERAMEGVGYGFRSDEAKVAGMKVLAQRALDADTHHKAKTLFDELSWFSTKYRPDWRRSST